MLPFVRKNHRLLFYLAWLSINLLQAGFTELIDDEAYYWIYSRFPAWGYFDHPPMIAVLIKAGYAIFQNELGVRLFILLLNAATIFIIEDLTEKKDSYLFYAIAGTLAVAQIGGILAVPDIPLIFFVALFFWLYRRFLQQMTVVNSLLLGACMALLVYSKYHGILIILFTLSSNPSLFRRYQAWLAAFVALLLFMPQLYWQFINDFPSIQYHLFERNASQYRISYTIEYIFGQIAMAGPLMGWLILWAAFQYKPGSLTERAMKFSLIGFYGFFLLSTLKGRVEANWTMSAFIPLIVLSHQFLRSDLPMRRWLFKSVPVSLVLIFLARIYLTTAMPPVTWVSKTDEIHGNKQWVSAVQQKAGDLPVAFTNSYQRASKYWFYEGRECLSMNGTGYRRNNFNFWPIEDSLLGKRVVIAGRYEPTTFTKLENLVPGTDSLCTLVTDPYFSFSKVQLRLKGDPSLQQGVLVVCGELRSPADYLSWFATPGYDTASLYLSIYHKTRKPVHIRTGYTVRQITQVKQLLRLELPLLLTPGIYQGKLGFSTAIPAIYSLNSTSFALKVE